MNAKQTALDAYLARTAAIHAKLEWLQQLADDHFGHDPDAIRWGHAGDLRRMGSGPESALRIPTTMEDRPEHTRRRPGWLHGGAW